ncbi:hypothetical protein SUGI_0786990 [Cryptomeria japonica]|nr:hypothetical protein SUGI_0786990 [Cryptomeria japonica]
MNSYNLTILIVSLFTFILLLICCCVVCCIFHAALSFKALRERSLQERSSRFALQWRSQNPVIPFDNEREWSYSGRGWIAWHFNFTPLPRELNGLSTEIFQSPEPLISLNSRNLQEIRFNPFVGSRRKLQSLQCLLPLMHGKEDINFSPACNYFEVSIISYSPCDKRMRKFGKIEGNVVIGLASRPAPPFRLPGMDAVSIGFHSNSGEIFTGNAQQVHASASKWSRIGATVGCGYDKHVGVVYFMDMNGSPIFTKYGVPDNVKNHLFPTLGADCDVTVVVNMGQHRFQYNIIPQPDFVITEAETENRSVVVTADDKSMVGRAEEIADQENYCGNKEEQISCHASNLVDKEIQTTLVQIAPQVNHDQIYGTNIISSMLTEEKQFCERVESSRSQFISLNLQ